MNKPRLVNLLIGKSIAETVLVGTIAVVAYLNAFPPTFYGWGEAVAETREIAGWAVNNADPWKPVEVQLFVDGKFDRAQTANLVRPDVVTAGWSSNELCGYSFELPSLPAGVHEARVYALHESGEQARYTLQLLGNPIRFVVNDDGSWRPSKSSD